MSITATQYLFRASIFTATTTATVGGYSVPASTRFQTVALTLSNTATTNQTVYADVSVWDGATAYPLLVKTPLYPGGASIVEGAQKHALPTGGAYYVTPYSTFVSAILSGIEIT